MAPTGFLILQVPQKKSGRLSGDIGPAYHLRSLCLTFIAHPLPFETWCLGIEEQEVGVKKRDRKQETVHAIQQASMSWNKM